MILERYGLKNHERSVDRFYDDPFVTSGYVTCVDDFQYDFNRQENSLRAKLRKVSGDWKW